MTPTAHLNQALSGCFWPRTLLRTGSTYLPLNAATPLHWDMASHIDQIRFLSALRSRGRHRPRYPGTSRWTQVWNGRAVTAQLAGSWSVDRSTLLWSFASNESHTLIDPTLAPPPSVQECGRTGGCPNGATHGVGWGIGRALLHKASPLSW